LAILEGGPINIAVGHARLFNENINMAISSVTSMLRHATTDLGQCAKAVNTKAASSGLTIVEYERLIGFGIACDWVRWAHDFQSINYSDRRRSESDRAYGLNQLSRFTFMWTAMNALFARSAIIELVDPAPISNGSELNRFRVLFQHSGLPTVDTNAFEATLHSLLALPMHVQHFPWTSVNSPPTILEVIYFKYTVASEKKYSLGKKLLHAATSKNYSDLDLPILIYATRNWNIHGVLLSSSFRGTRKKFNVWIDTINMSLAKVLEGAALALRRAI
jgi:hypothetical protein